MTQWGAVRPVGVHPHRTRPVPRRRLGRVLAGLLLATLAVLAPVLPDAAAAPAAPAPQATATPSATPSATASGSPSATPRPRPRPDPEGDRWVELAVIGGGSLLGAVLMFMLIGGLIRWRNRRRYRD